MMKRTPGAGTSAAALLDSTRSTNTDVCGWPGNGYLMVGMLRNQAKALKVVLQHAASRGDPVDVDVVHDDGLPVSIWFNGRTVRAAAVLLEHGASFHRYWQLPDDEPMSATPGLKAAAIGAPGMLRRLLEHGLDANSVGELNHHTPLLVAALTPMSKNRSQLGAAQDELGRVQCIELLLAAGADPFAWSSGGRDAFAEAAACSVDVLRIVLHAAAAYGSAPAHLDAAATSSCGCGSTSSNHGRTAASSRFLRRLREPLPDPFEYRASAGPAWSAAEARTVKGSRTDEATDAGDVARASNASEPSSAMTTMAVAPAADGGGEA